MAAPDAAIRLRVLVAEDDADVRLAVVDSLRAAGHDVVAVRDGGAALEAAAATAFDLLITDVRIPKIDGLMLFRRVKEAAPGTDVILMTSFGSVADAVAALKAGARDYLTKPFDVDELIVRVAALAERRGLQRDLEAARAQLAGATETAILGESPGIRRLLDIIATVADSDAPVLVTGESGTGKELVARRIHTLSSRRSGPFVAVNCAAFPETLLEAELFGHERGAFTGAVKKRDGRFRAASGGTLLLDEAAEIPLPAQAKLLRVLQEGVVEPLGSNTAVRVDVRIVSATHRDLKRRIAEGLFREDLYYRLNAVNLHVPPLRERGGDLTLLASAFLQRFTPAGKAVPDVSLDAWRALSVYPFPGNVRELAHAIQHAVLLSHGGTIEREHLPADIAHVAAVTSAQGQPEVRPLAAVVKQAEREAILHALAVARGKRIRAAELLGISRKNLWEKLHAHGIVDSDVDDGRE